jgi:chitinase
MKFVPFARKRRRIVPQLLETLESRLLLSTSGFPSVAVTTADITVNAGTTGQCAWVPISLSRASSLPVTVLYATQNVTAAAGTDYTGAVGVVTFRPGQMFNGIPVWVNADAHAEPDKAFNVVLLAATNVTLTTPPAGPPYSRVAIRNSTDAGIARPWLRISNATTNAGGWEVFNINLSAPSTRPISLRYQTVAMTATNADYTPVNGILTIPAGATSARLGVRTKSTGATHDKSFALFLTSPCNATIAHPAAFGKIVAGVNQSISIAAATTTEITGIGIESMIFTVSLARPATQTVTVAYATSDATATAGSDYTAISGTLTFNIGESTKTIEVPITGSNPLADETLTMTLSNPTRAAIATPTATGTIIYGGIDLSDDLDEPVLGETMISAGILPAASFNTGSSMAVLSSVTVPLQMYSTGTATLMVYSDETPEPGFLVGTLTSPPTYSTTTHRLTTFQGNDIVLNANSTYWVVIKADTGTFGLLLTHLGGIGDGFTGVGLQSPDSGATWNTIGGGTMVPQLQVIVKDPVVLSDNLETSLDGNTASLTSAALHASERPAPS